MANRTINSTFKLRGDFLSVWTTKNPVLAEREVAIVFIPANAGSGLNEPATLMKVGDGTTAFNSLPYVSALAGDVAEWAKAATKPSYTANEINGLADFINSTITDTDTQYKMEQDATDGHILRFYSKAKNASDWTLATTITTVDTVYDDTALAGRVTTAEGAIDALEALVGSTSVQAQINAAISALDLGNTYYSKSLGEANATAIANMKDGEDIDSFGDVEAALAGKQDTIPDNTYDAYGAAATAKSEVIGNAETDTKDSKTIEGTRKYAVDLANGAAAEVIGESTDTKNADTIYGAKAFATDAVNTAKSELKGSGTDASTADTISGAKKYAQEQAAAVLGNNSDSAGDATVYGANKAAAAAQATADAKVASVTAGNNSVTVGGTATAPTIAVKVDPAANNAIQVTDDGVKVVIPDAAVINVVKKATANDGYIASYQVTVDGTPVGVDIDIPKDYLVKDADIKVVETADDPYEGAEVGDKYIDFTVNTVEGSGNESHIYLPVNDLAHVYTAGNGIAISAADVISVVIDSNNANGLSVGANGIALAIVTQSAAGAMSAADKTKLDGISTGANKVEASETNGNVKIDGAETKVYELPSTVLDATDTYVFDGGNA